MSNVIFSMMTSSTESLSQLSSHITGLIAEVSEELRFDKVCLKGIYKQFWECTGEFHHERSNSDPITIDSYVAQKSKMLLGGYSWKSDHYFVTCNEKIISLY